MFDPVHLETLATILRVGSFEAAAHELNVTPSAVSQRIRALEERVGAALIVRETPARPTPIGARLARHAEDLRLLERALAQDIGLNGQTERPVVRIAVNADSIATWVLPALAKADGLLFDIVIDDQDHSAEWLRRGEVQAAVTSHPGPIAGCDAHPLGVLRYLATASPDFAARWFPDGPTAEALSRAPALIFNLKDRLQADWARDVCGHKLTLPGHFLPSSAGFVEAARLGMGWGMNPEPLIRDELARGALVVLADRPLDVMLYWQVGRLTAKALAPLTGAIRRQARRVLRPA